MKDFPDNVSEFIDFIRNDIWRIRLKKFTGAKRFLIKTLRIVFITVKEFIYDKCPLRASALTFYSILSIVPVVAMVFAVAKGFGFQKRLETQLLRQFAGQEDVIMRVIDFSRNLLENTRGGLIAGVGVIILLWAIIKVLDHIEQSFNDIWGIQKSRSFSRKFSDYLSMMLIAPVLFITSSGTSVLIATRLAAITQEISLLGFFSPVILIIIEILPFCLIWILFTFVYIFMPNTKVSLTSGSIAGITAGTMFVIVQKIYIYFQVGVAKYNAIYGSFAALPLFLIWMELSWFIVLFGAEISFAYQNVDEYEFEPDRKNISHSFRKLLSLIITHLLVSKFIQGETPLSAIQISEDLDIPVRLAREILQDLRACDLISETSSEKEKESTYQPARDINQFSIAYVTQTLENKGTDAIPIARTKSFDSLSKSLENLSDAIKNSPSNVLLKDL